MPSKGALGGSGDGEHIPAHSSELEHPRMPVCHGQTAGKGQQGADVLSDFAHSQGFPQLGFGEESFMLLQLPPKCWGLSLVKWLGRMKGMNYMGFSSPCQNNFSFQGTIFLDVGLDALCQGNAGGKCSS